MANYIHILKLCDEIFTLTAIIRRRSLKITRHERKPNYGHIRLTFLFFFSPKIVLCMNLYLLSLPFLVHKTVKDSKMY